MPEVRMYCTAVCPYCVRAEQLLLRRGAEITKIRVDLDPGRYEEMLRVTGGRRTVPQIFIGERHVGGYDDLVELDMAGELVELLAHGTA